MEILTLASAAGFTLPFTAKAPPRITIWAMFFANSGSICTACKNITLSWNETQNEE